jgi:hypothetical protein
VVYGSGGIYQKSKIKKEKFYAMSKTVLSFYGNMGKEQNIIWEWFSHSHYELLFLLLFPFVHMEKLLRGGWFDSRLMVALS